MGCGCKGTPGPLPQARLAGKQAPTAARVAVYQVKKDGAVVLSTTSPVAARQEAKRIGASVQVTSRAVDAAGLEAMAETG